MVTAASMAHEASTAFPPRANISAPAVAASGLPVMASQCRAWSGGFSVVWASRGAPAQQSMPSASRVQERVTFILLGR